MLLRWFALVATTLLLALASLSCRQPLELTGTVTFRGRTALPPNAVLEVQLADVSRSDAPAVILARRTYTSLGAPPFAFALRPEVRQLDPRGTYAVQARILVGEQLFMVNRRRAKIDNAAPTKPIEVQLDPVPRTVGD